MRLTADEVRVLGCLIEKELATPEYYPLSVNALMLACNQKTNREPILTLDEAAVGVALERLRQAGLAHRSAEGGRVSKYAHNAVSKLGLDGEELATLAVLLLRGPQTAGEVRTRVERMHKFDDLARLEAALQRLMEGDAPLVARLERLPGRKEHRYAQLLGDAPSSSHAPSLSPSHTPSPSHAPSQIGAVDARTDESPSSAASPSEERLAHLESTIAELASEVAALRQELRDLKSQLG